MNSSAGILGSPCFFPWLRRFLVLAVLGACLGNAIGQSPMAVVGTRFKIVAPLFTNNLEAAQLDACHDEVALQIAERCEQSLSYLDWRALTNAPSSEDPPWILQVTMEQEGTTAIPGIVLTYRSVEPGASSILFQQSLYPANNLEWDAQNEARLRDDLRATNAAALSNTANLKSIQERFLRRIPVARALVADPEFQRFFLPVPWERLLPGEGSVLLAKYFAGRDRGQRIPVTARLIPSEDWAGRVGCRVSAFNYPPDFLTNGVWHQRMLESVSNAVPDSIFVCMEQYEKDQTFNTVHGLVTEISFSSTGGGQ